MEETIQPHGRIAQLSFEERKKLPHFFRLLSVASRLYREHALAYLVIALFPYVLVRLVQATLTSLDPTISTLIVVALSIALQLISVIALIDFAREGEGASVGKAVGVGLKLFPQALILMILLDLIGLGAIGLIVGPVLFATGIPFATILTSPILFFLSVAVATLAAAASILSLYVLVYERVMPHVALIRAFAYDRETNFAVMARFLSLLVLGFILLLAVVFLGQQLNLVGFLTQAATATFDDVAVIIFLPLFLLYGSAMYEVARSHLGQIPTKSGDRVAFWVMVGLGLLVLITQLF